MPLHPRSTPHAPSATRRLSSPSPRTGAGRPRERRLAPGAWKALAAGWGLAMGVVGAGAAEVYAIGAGAPAGSKAHESLAAFASAVPCVRPGDRIVLEAGRTFRGSLALTLCEGAGTGVVTVETAGAATGKPARLQPAVSARDLGLAWKPVAEGELPGLQRTRDDAWALFVLGPLPQAAVQLIVGDQVAAMAATPNQGRARVPRTLLLSGVQTRKEGCPEWMCLRSDDPTWAAQVKTVAALPEAARPVLVLRNSPWSYTRHKIAGVDAGKGVLRIDAAEGATGTAEDRDFVEPGFGVVLMNSAATLDELEEWVYDAGSKQVYLAARKPVKAEDLGDRVLLSLDSPNRKDPAGDPALSLSPSGKARAAGVKLVVRNLEILGAAGSGLRVRDIGSVEASRLSIRQTGEHGIAASGLDKLSVVDSQISDTGNNGILATETVALEIRGNQIRETGRIGAQPQLTMQFNGMRASGFSRVDIRDNTIEGVGYAGIMLGERGAFDDRAGGAPKLNISGNSIQRFCRMLNDCGAIYINGGGKDRDKPSPIDPTIEKRILGNRIQEPEPNLQGLPADKATAANARNKTGAWVRMVGAVYLDHGASGYDIRDNIVAGLYTPYGWNVFNGGLENACTRAVTQQCKAGPKAYRCYTDALSNCNTAPARR